MMHYFVITIWKVKINMLSSQSLSIGPHFERDFHFPKITVHQVVANPVIFVSFNRYFLTAVRNLPYNALPCLYQQDQGENTIADFGMEEHGGNYC